MAIRQYLAMTAAEIRNAPQLPGRIGWMACHFSPYGTGLSNIPRSLPEDSLLILNDRTPIHRHDPKRIAAELEECAAALGCSGILLDFQRPGYEEIPPLVCAILDALPCPAALSDLYAEAAECAVFLPPVPLHMPFSEYIAPWQDREVWLDITTEGEAVTVTADGAVFAALPNEKKLEGGFADEALHCHYQIATEEDRIQFQLQRTAADLQALLAEAEAFGVTNAVGLYQQFRFSHCS